MKIRPRFDTAAIMKLFLRMHMFVTTNRGKGPPYLPAFTAIVRDQLWREWGYADIAEYLSHELMWTPANVLAGAQWAEKYKG